MVHGTCYMVHGAPCPRPPYSRRPLPAGPRPAGSWPEHPGDVWRHAASVSEHPIDVAAHRGSVQGLPAAKAPDRCVGAPRLCVEALKRCEHIHYVHPVASLEYETNHLRYFHPMYPPSYFVLLKLLGVWRTGAASTSSWCRSTTGCKYRQLLRGG